MNRTKSGHTKTPNRDSAAVPSLGKQLHPLYVIRSKISEDPSGILYSANYTPDGRKTAVKVLASGVVRDKNAPSVGVANTLKVLDVLTGIGSETLLILEHPRGESLKKVLTKQGNLSARLSVSIIVKVISVLKSLHENHRALGTLNPGTVFVSISLARGERFEIQVADFSVASCGAVLNHERYRSPELADQGGACEPQDDLWVAAMMLYEMLFGLVPFQPALEDSVFSQDFNETLFLPHGFVAEFPTLAVVLKRALHQKPKFRYPSAEAMRDALIKFQKNPKVASRPIVPAMKYDDDNRSSIPTASSLRSNSLVYESSDSRLDSDITRRYSISELSSRPAAPIQWSATHKRLVIAAAVGFLCALLLAGLWRIVGSAKNKGSAASQSGTASQPTATMKAAGPSEPVKKNAPDPDDIPKMSPAAAPIPQVEADESPPETPVRKYKKKPDKETKSGPVDDLGSNPAPLKNNPFPVGE